MKKQTFEIKGEYIELIKLLKASGLCDMGSDAKFAVSNQQVKVNGEIDTRLRAKIKLHDKVEFNGNLIEVM